MLRYVKKLLVAGRLRRQRNAVKKQEQLDDQRLRGELEDCRRQLNNLESWFDLACDPHTIDCCIYQRRALQARYDGLLLQARQRFAAASEKEGAGSAAAVLRIK